MCGVVASLDEGVVYTSNLYSTPTKNVGSFWVKFDGRRRGRKEGRTSRQT